MSGGGKTSTSTQQVSIPPEVLARYNAVNAKAEQTAATPFQQYSTNPNAFVAPINEQQQAGIANINQAANMGQGYYGAAAGLTGAGAGPTNVGPVTGQNIGQYMNPFLSSVVSPAAQLLQQQQQAQMSGQTGQAIQQGAFGGDRAGIAAANLAGQQGLAFANAINPLLSQGYTQALQTATQQQGVDLAQQQANLQRQLMAGAQFGQLGTGAQQSALAGAQAQLGAGALQQQTQQAGLSALYNQFLQQQAYPFQVAQFLANIAEGTGALSGSTTTGTQPAPFFSDERLKEDVRDIGRTHDGQKIVEFRYKGEGGPKRMGLLAQDVEKHHPDAVGLAGGYKTVDYDRALHDSASMGGGVHPEHAGEGFAQGGAPYLDIYGMPGQGASRLPPDVIQQAMAGKNRQLMLPQGGLKPAQTGMSQVMDAVKTEQGLKGAFNDAGSAWDSASKFYSKATASPESQNSPQDYDKPEPYDPNKAHGGIVGYASGGMPYSGEGLDIPDEENKRQLATAGNLPGQQSGLGGIKDALGAVGAIKGLASLPGSISSAAGTIGSGLSGAAEAIGGAASGIGGALGSAAEFLPFLLLKDGGAVHREHHADGDSVGDTSVFGGLAAASAPEDPKLVEAMERAIQERQAAQSVAQPLAQSVYGGLAGPIAGPPTKEDAALGRSLESVARSRQLDPLGAPTEIARRPIASGLQPVSGEARPVNPNRFEQAFRQTLGFEGGYSPRDSNGAPVNMGINQAHNPDVDVKNLTQDQAREIYKTRYWDAIGADKLDPAIQNMAFDTAVIAGPAKARELLRQSGGDPQKFMELRSAFQRGLVENDPEKYGRFAKAWENRNATLAGGEPPRIRLAQADTGTTSDAGFLGGLAGAARGAGNTVVDAAKDTNNWFKGNQEWLIPLLSGIGTMASSPSRYFGAALLQGIGGGAKSYADMQNQLLQREKLKAETGRVGAETQGMQASNFLKNIYNTPLGTYVFLANGVPIKMDEYIRRTNAGERIPPLVAPPPDAQARIEQAYGTGSAGTTAAAPANTTPAPAGTAPASAATTATGVPAVPGGTSIPPSPPKARVQAPAGITYGDASRKLAATEGDIPFGESPAGTIAQRTTEEYRSRVTKDAEVARQNSPHINELATTMADAIASHGANETGAFAPQRAQIIGLANTISRSVGGPEIGNLDSNTDVVGKITTLLGTQAAASGNQESYRALDAIRQAIPNLGMNPDASAQLTADLMMMKQRSLDREAHAKAYASESPNGLMNHAANAFREENSEGKYKKEQDVLKDLILKKPERLKMMMSGTVSKQQIDDAIKAWYGNGAPTGMYRYFATR